MRLYLAVAVLVLALVAYTEAQDATMEEKMTQFGDQVTQLGKDFAEKAKNTFENIHNSETAENIRKWFNEQMEKVKKNLQ
ncbi:apolipoprotein C-I [Gouania willdenowi]|uniref:apolipoprotein C-I n=1 Tax=Gouania willdenowi TaxID=441366 RepID=UPI001054BDCD|nr:apolipoprotein C-I-like [Gouania willdenowi]XP_028327060.1 apolipoprotein C-I-like [Gouania willdenowi]